MKQKELDALSILIDLVSWFREKGTDPTVARIATGKFIAMSHAMYEESLARGLQASFIESLNKEFEQILSIKKAIYEHTDEGRKV